MARAAASTAPCCWEKGREAGRALGAVFTLSLSLGLLFLAAGELFVLPLLRGIGATGALLPTAKEYTSILLLGAPLSMISISLSSIARTDGSPVLAMGGFLAGAVVNLLLDPLFIFVFGWGVAGAAIATVTSQALTAVIFLVYFTRHARLRLTWGRMKPDGGVYRQILLFGLSVGLIQIAATVFQVVLQRAVRTYGAAASIGTDGVFWAIGIIARVSNVIQSICVGIGVGIHPIIGFNTGAGLRCRVNDTYRRAVLYASAVSALGWVLCMLFPAEVGSLFGAVDPARREFFAACMRILTMGLFTAGFQAVTSNTVLARGEIKKALFLSVLRQLLLGVPLLLILPTIFGFNGVLIASPVSDLTCALIMLGVVLWENTSRRRAAKAASHMEGPSGQ